MKKNCRSGPARKIHFFYLSKVVKEFNFRFPRPGTSDVIRFVNFDCFTSSHCMSFVCLSFALCSKWKEQHGRILRFAVGPVYANKSLTIYSSDFVFPKYKQDSAFRVSGVLQLAKTGPPVTKNLSLLRLFLSNAMMA